MKNKITFVALLISSVVFSQEKKESDTTRFNMGEVEVLLIDHSKNSKNANIQDDSLSCVTKKCKKTSRKEAHWAGVDFGFRTMLNDNFTPDFENNVFLENNIAQSMVWNINFLERKFPIFKHHLGFTTGLGFSFTQFAFNNNYIINTTGPEITAAVDPIYTYSKNKLNATYLTLPILLEFCSNKLEDEGFYLSAGLVGGVKIYSRIHREGSFDGKSFDESVKGDYEINPFILNSAVRLGYKDLGLFVDYSLLSYFKTNKTENVHPLTFGLSLNF